jgi:hypothetical protein
VTETHSGTGAAASPPTTGATELPEAWRPSTRERTSVPSTTRERAKDLFLGKALPNEALAH